MANLERFAWGCVHATIIIGAAVGTARFPSLSVAITAGTGILCGSLPTPFQGSK